MSTTATTEYRLVFFGSANCRSVPEVLNDRFDSRVQYRHGEWCKFEGEGVGLRYDTLMFADRLQKLLLKGGHSFSIKLEVLETKEQEPNKPLEETGFIFAISYSGIVDITKFC